MNRIIKFKAWDDVSKVMLNHVPIILFSENAAYSKDRNYVHNSMEWDLVFDPILLQYTGLKDRNKKDWYEGDLVRVNSEAPIHETYWNENEMGWKIKMVGSTSYFNINAPLFEIIGNIYENPELLKS